MPNLTPACIHWTVTRESSIKTQISLVGTQTQNDRVAFVFLSLTVSCSIWFLDSPSLRRLDGFLIFLSRTMWPVIHPWHFNTCPVCVVGLAAVSHHEVSERHPPPHLFCNPLSVLSPRQLMPWWHVVWGWEVCARYRGQVGEDMEVWCWCGSDFLCGNIAHVCLCVTQDFPYASG